VLPAALFPCANSKAFQIIPASMKKTSHGELGQVEQLLDKSHSPFILEDAS
jgi:hypothetical protein